MKVFLKLNFEDPQEYFFNGYVNNEESNDIDISVKELNENPTIILDSGYETINGKRVPVITLKILKYNLIVKVNVVI